ISRVLHNRGIRDDSGESTKWRRLYRIFLAIQEQDKCANKVIDFIRALLTPARFVGKNDEFELRRKELNVVLAFAGLEYGADGNFRSVNNARTLDDAEQRAQTLRSKFRGRRIHP